MIKFSLRCADGHRFDSWFANSDAYDALAKSGHLSCAVCGSADVRKDIMAPRISPTADADALPVPTPSASEVSGEAPMPDLKALRETIERESDYVGASFAKEARAIHDGTAPSRSIYGEARPEEARALLKEGVPVAPLPFIPTKKAN